MNELNLAVDLPAAAVSVETVAAPAVRDAMLSGTLLRQPRSPRWRTASANSSARRRATRSTCWFGAERGARLRIDPQALRDAIDRDIAAIDAMLSEQLDAILHHPRLRRLEGTWRGLAWLVDGVELSNRLKIKILNIGWPEICRDLERAIEFDQSQLFRKVYEEEFGMPGGEPYGLLVVDHEVRHRPSAEFRTDDVTALAALSGVAAAAFSPVMLGASPALLEVGQLRRSRDVDRSRRPVAQCRTHALAQPRLARRHALRRRHPAARAGAAALAGRRHPRPTASATPNTLRPTTTASG